MLRALLCSNTVTAATDTSVSRVSFGVVESSTYLPIQATDPPPLHLSFPGIAGKLTVQLGMQQLPPPLQPPAAAVSRTANPWVDTCRL